MAKHAAGPRSRCIIDLSCDEAREFFLESHSYFDITLPPYFRFDGLLNDTAQVLKGKPLSDLRCCNPRHLENINHVLMTNKDGRYSWRPVTLIHPALYVSLVHSITQSSHWAMICDHLRTSLCNSNSKCLSLPVQSLTKRSNKAEQITTWFQEVEQKSIELSLDYELLIRTDLADCYASIYTHSISWALHTGSVRTQGFPGTEAS